MNWLKSTSPVVYWVAFSLDLTVGAWLHTVFAQPVNSVANLALSSLKKVLGDMIRSFSGLAYCTLTCCWIPKGYWQHWGG